MENSTPEKRPYRKRRRAELEQKTRLRITEAAIELHGSSGPARTTISAVADRAGVERATVYRHFGDEETLFAACSAHWLALHPLPDTAAWSAIADPDERLRSALLELYAWFDGGEPMVEKTTRDVALVPALRPAMEALGAWFDVAAGVVVRGRRERGARRKRVRAAVGHALSFATWRSLIREQGLTVAEAVDMMIGLVAAAAQD